MNNDQHSSTDTNHAQLKLQERIELMKQELGNSSDLFFRHCQLGRLRTAATIMWINGIVSAADLNNNVISPLLDTKSMDIHPSNEQAVSLLSATVITAAESTVINSPQQAIPMLLNGWTVVMLDGFDVFIAVNTQGYETRSIEEPASAGVIRGPRDGFVESLTVNISLIRRRIKSSMMRVESKKVGEVSHTEVALLYVEGRVHQQTLDEVRHRLEHISIDAVLESHYIEEIIKDSPWSIFPTVYNTERPDDVAGLILEGQVAILVDGTPFALVLPCTLFHLLKTPEDLYLAYPIATFIRWIRFVGFFVTLLLPSLYVGVLTFHPEMLPPQLLSSILSARDGVPFPVLMEAVLMELTFEGLREASIRMPRSIGSAISIVGALVIGESAVKAGLISSPSVIVVAGTAIASFTIPSVSLSGSIRILKFVMLLFASLFGLYGIIIGMFMVGIHLSAIRSVGLPYLSPFAPFKKHEALQTLTRVPWFSLRTKKK
ncbi:spore germination protein [Paenibacillus sp. SYP-B4298]|uniref:spore germination protein n=1 Tax=Paenibacillus sp. SYP-B4298 TaxID=2996034 RepID=UPI0022DD8AE7|nr:spore germination protein [Paenibacillus sp. SYP-B4298]